MATTKTEDASPQKDVEQLSAQIATLREDISDISRTLAQLGNSSTRAAADAARRKAGEVRDAGAQQFHAAQSQAEELGNQAADAVRNQPAAAMGLAVGIGFLLGFMTGRK